MKTILITVASGFIATNFVKQYNHKYKFLKLSHIKISNHITLAELKGNPDLWPQINVIIHKISRKYG